jgi:hypothetical protein
LQLASIEVGVSRRAFKPTAKGRFFDIIRGDRGLYGLWMIIGYGTG